MKKIERVKITAEGTALEFAIREGSIAFDGITVMKDGLFVHPDLLSLNP